MKTLSLLTLLLLTFNGISQRPELSGSWEDSLYGLEMRDGREILPRTHKYVIENFRIEDTSTIYYIATKGHQDKLYVWDGAALKELSTGHSFSSITYTYVASRQKELYIGITETAEYLYFSGSGWNTLNHIGYRAMGGCNSDGKWAICQGGKALTEYIYDAVLVDQGVPFQVKTAEGWQILDDELQPMKNPFEFECHEHISGGKLCSDFTHWKIPDGPILKLGSRMGFNIDGPSYTDLRKGFAIRQNGKYGIVNAHGEVLIPFLYEEIYVSRYHHRMYDYFDQGYTHVVNNGEGYRYYANHRELNLLPHQNFIGFHSQWLLVEHNDTLYYEDYEHGINELYGGKPVRNITTGLYGYVEMGGYVSWDFEYEYLADIGNYYTNLYFAIQDGEGAIYDSIKQKVIDLPYDDIMAINGLGGLYYSVRSDEHVGKYALVKLDMENKKWIELTDFVFTYFSNYANGGGIFARHEDGYGVTIRADGSFKKDQY